MTAKRKPRVKKKLAKQFLPPPIQQPHICGARLRSIPFPTLDNDDRPFKCGLPAGHKGLHRCECECGHEWHGDALVGRLIFYKGKPEWIREIVRLPHNTPGHYAGRTHESSVDYRPGYVDYGFQNLDEVTIRAGYEFLPWYELLP